MTDLLPLSDPSVPLDDAYAICNDTIDNGLFTAMRFHPDTMEVERLYSTNTAAYSVSGRKPKRSTPWGDKVLIAQEHNCGYGPIDIAWAFDDHEKILDLGLLAVLNLPVVAQGRTLGTINYLRSGPPFSVDEVATGLTLAAALAKRGTL